MTTFDDRDKSFENKFAHDEELAFKVTARGHKLLALWAAGKLGKTGADAEQYATTAVEAEFGQSKTDLSAKLLADLAAAGLSITAKELKAELDRQLAAAKKQIMGDAG